MHIHSVGIDLGKTTFHLVAAIFDMSIALYLRGILALL
jgi:hypothetical protein